MVVFHKVVENVSLMVTKETETVGQVPVAVETVSEKGAGIVLEPFHTVDGLVDTVCSSAWVLAATFTPRCQEADVDDRMVRSGSGLLSQGLCRSIRGSGA